MADIAAPGGSGTGIGRFNFSTRKYTEPTTLPWAIKMIRYTAYRIRQYATFHPIPL
jgi:hypothetical protein